MDLIIMIALIIIVYVIPVRFLISLLHKKKSTKREAGDIDEAKIQKQDLPIDGAYQKSWLFSYNEKDAYHKLLPIANELGYTVFAKVRLLDLLEPTKGNPKYKTYFYKVQSKHVDFVLCDEKLVARYIIELDDSSHDAPDRKIRDDFVDKVLTSVGYKVIHTKYITENIKEQITK